MRDQKISICLSTTEKRLLVKNAKRAGCNASDYVRTVLRCIFLGVTTVPKPKLGKATPEQEQATAR